MKRLIIINIFLLITSLSISAQRNDLINSKAELARKYEQSGDLEKAKQLYNDVLKEQPWNFEIVRSLNEIFLKLKEYDNSIILIENRIKLNPSDPNLYGLLGYTYATMGDNGKAYKTWDEGIEKNKASIVAYRVIADYAIQKRAFDKAVDILKKGREIINDPLIFTYDLGNLYSVTMKFKDAADIYCKLLLNNPEQIGAVQSRMNRYLTHPNAAKATIETVDQFYSRYKLPIYLDLLSYLYTREENYGKALDVIIQKDEMLSNNGTSILSFAQKVFRDGDYTTSGKAYRFLIDNYGSASFLPEAKLGYVRAKEEMLNHSNIDSSESWKPFRVSDTSDSYRYQSIIEDYKNLAKLYLKDDIIASAKLRIGIIEQTVFHNYDAAERIFNELNESRLAPLIIPQLTERLAEIALGKNKLEVAQTLYNKLDIINRTDRNKKSLADFMNAKILFWKGDFPRAAEALKEISKNLSDDYANDAIELSIIITTLKRDSLSLLNYAKGDLLAQQNKYDKAAEIFKNLADNKNLLLLNDIAKYRFAQMEIALDKFNDGIAALEELSGSEIKNVYSDKALYLLGNTYLYAFNNFEKASSAFQNLLDTFPNSLYFDESRQKLNIINKGLKKTI